MTNREFFENEPGTKTPEELATELLEQIKSSDLGKKKDSLDPKLPKNESRPDIDNLGIDPEERGGIERIGKKIKGKNNVEGLEKKGGRKHKIERTTQPAEEGQIEVARQEEINVFKPEVPEQKIIESKIENPNLKEKRLRDELSDLESLAGKLLTQGNLSRRRLILEEIKKVRSELEKSSGNSSEAVAA